VISYVVYRPVDAGSVIESKKVFETSDSAPEHPVNNDTVNSDVSKQRGKEILEEIRTNLASVLTVHNVKEVMIFISVFIVTCITGSFHLVRYVGDYSIKFMREFSVFIEASTPIFLSVIDFFSKCVGGFYIMIVMLWRASKNEPPPRVNWGPNQRALPAPRNTWYNYRR
jgi:hypothetical protein